MNLFIKIKDGLPFEHPILEENFCETYPNVDINNLPPEFARFERVERPNVGFYEVLVSETPSYELVDGVYKDVWHVRAMTAEEKEAKQQQVRDVFFSRPYIENFSTWIWSDAANNMVAPIPRPTPLEGQDLRWCGADNNWKEAPPKPTDGKLYGFNFLTWEWVEIKP